MQEARRHDEVHESLGICRKTIAELSSLDQSTRPRQRLIDWSMRLEFCERVDPAQQLVAQHGRNIWTLQELCQDGHTPRKVVPHPNDNFEIILEDTHQPYVSRRDAWGAQERFARVEGRVKLPGRHLQLETLWYGEARDVCLLEKALAEIKRLHILQPCVARKAVRCESLEKETCLLILPLFIAFCRILGTPGQRAAQKPEALRHILAMGLKLASVLGITIEPVVSLPSPARVG